MSLAGLFASVASASRWAMVKFVTREWLITGSFALALVSYVLFARGHDPKGYTGYLYAASWVLFFIGASMRASADGPEGSQ